jgi:hypothetical protein
LGTTQRLPLLGCTPQVKSLLDVNIGSGIGNDFQNGLPGFRWHWWERLPFGSRFPRTASRPTHPSRALVV